MPARIITCLVIICLLVAGAASAATWVSTPAPVNGLQGTYAVGDACCAWVSTNGDQMYFFDVWSGAWTELTLPETHTLVSIQAAGNLALVVFQDLVVAYDGPDATTHTLPLDGAVLDTGSPSYSYGCGDVLAVVCTDEEFVVYDSIDNQWHELEYTMPADYTNHAATVVMDDYVVSELVRNPGPGYLNLAYSRRTRTFLEEPEGIYNVLNGPNYLDHGFVGFGGDWNEGYLKGYSAYTGVMTTGTRQIEKSLGSYSSPTDRRAYRHLGGGALANSPEPYVMDIGLWVYDTVTGGWEHLSYRYDTRELGSSGLIDFGGRFAFHRFVDDDDNETHTMVFAGHNHTWHTQSPGLFGTGGIGRYLGGRVLAVHQSTYLGPDVWWCRTDHQPVGQYTSSTRQYAVCAGAGEQWFSTGQRTNGDPLMDLFFYHGPSNTMYQVETWSSTQTITHKGTNVHCLVTYGDDVDVNFFSGITGTVEQRNMSDGSYPGAHFNDNMALVFHNGRGDYLFDARTGIVQSRGIEYSSASLGGEVVTGYDPATFTAHAYSAATGTWSTLAAGESGYARAGDQIGHFQNQAGTKHWGFSSYDGSWTELNTTGSFPQQLVGGRTIIVKSTDRLWAYWPFDGISDVGDDQAWGADVAHALGQAYCAPNPFNGRAVVRFQLPLRADVTVEVYDLRGAKVATLIDESREPGLVTAVWNTEQAASGAYIVRLEAAGQEKTKKITLVK